MLSRRTDDCVREAERLTARRGHLKDVPKLVWAEMAFHLATDID